MKKYYDVAISKKPECPDIATYVDGNLTAFYATLNRKAVDILNQMRG